MEQQNPLISILIASYNHGKYIEETIRSIWNQTYRNVEIVAVDDCSPDNSWELLQRLVQESPVPMRIARNEHNSGPSTTFNAALAMAEGELAAFVASDDVFTENRFTGSAQLFAEQPSLQVVFANGRTIRDGVVGRRIHAKKALDLLALPLKDIQYSLYTQTSPLFIQAALFRKSTLDRVGGFDSDALADDWLLNSRLFASLEAEDQYAYLDEDVVLYRQHDDNVHKNYLRQERLKLDFIEKHTPEQFKPAGFANIYYWAARQRLKRGEFQLAWEYYHRAQKSQFRWSRIRFVFAWLQYRLKLK